MQHRFLPGYFAYPALVLALGLTSPLRAQTSTPAAGSQTEGGLPAAGTSTDQTPTTGAPAAQAPAAQAPAAQTDQAPALPAPAQTGKGKKQAPDSRARVLRDAQARVMIRRRQRQQQIIQDTYSHKYEAYFGGGYLRFRPGPALQHNTEAAWNIGFTDWIKPKLGITGDVRGYYGTTNTRPGAEFQVFAPSISQYTFMAGPQYRFYQGLHWAWNAQVLAGVGHANFDTGTGGFAANLVGLYPNANKLNVSVGVPVEYNVSPALAVRLMPNYLLTTYGGDAQHNLGFTAGIVYRFGRR